MYVKATNYLDTDHIYLGEYAINCRMGTPEQNIYLMIDTALKVNIENYRIAYLGCNRRLQNLQ